MNITKELETQIRKDTKNKLLAYLNIEDYSVLIINFIYRHEFRCYVKNYLNNDIFNISSTSIGNIIKKLKEVK